MASLPQLRDGLTLEQFLRLPEIDEHPYLEYIDGRIEAKVSPQKQHSAIQSRFLTCLNGFSQPARLGLAFPELRCTFEGRSIVPDIVFLRREHIDVDEHGELVDETLRPPDIHIEIVSPDQPESRPQERIRFTIANGCLLGWLINPCRETIDVFRPGRRRRRLKAGDVLEGEPVLPGFRLPVAEVFGWLKLNL